MPDKPAAAPATVTFTLDGRPVTARPGELVISAAERAGTYIPRFCYHPRMQPVGMCRMCLVEISGPRGATLQPACFVHAAPGMEVVTDSPKVKKAQDGVLEFLLVNHPLDCPVCDKGGECPLQDQTLAYGPGETRFIEEKRHFEKPLPISDLVLLDRERCIQCARCTRFAEELAGEPQIDFAGRGERVEVATFPGRPFTSYFSGNTVQICPVGALTATPYRFTARPWDLDQVESTCTTCALGCRVTVQSSSNRLTRLLGIDADPVNQGWLCDKDRFVFESVNGSEPVPDPVPPAIPGQSAGAVPATATQVGLPSLRRRLPGRAGEEEAARQGRLVEPQVRKGGELVAATWTEALAAAAAGLDAARRAGGAQAVALLGGARCTNEGAYAWAKLAKGVLGTDSVDAQLGDGLPADLVLSLPRATIDDACAARTVVLLTGDVREELPVLFLRLRQAALERGLSLVELAPGPTSLTPYAAVSLRARPGDAPVLAQALVADADPAAMPVHPEGPVAMVEDVERARDLVAGAADDGEPAGTGVVVVLGRPSLAEHQGVVADAARVLAASLPGARFLSALRRGNVHGALDMGLAPGILPGRVSRAAGADWFGAAWGSVPEADGLDTTGALTAAASGGPVRAMVVLGADVIGDFPDRQLAERAIEGAEFVVAVTGHPSATTVQADVVLPVAVEHERPGTTSNVEGRVSRLGQKLVPPGQAWPDWMVAAELATELGADLGFASATDVWDEIERLTPLFAGVTGSVLASPSAGDGVVVPFDAAAPRRVAPTDPMAIPGVESVERQGAPARVGLAAPAGGGAGDGTLAAGVPAGTPADTVLAEPVPAGDVADDVPEGSSPTDPVAIVRPEVGAGLANSVAARPAMHVPPADSYSLRLVSGRRLFDAGSAVTYSPSLVPLMATAVVRANPYDLDRLGAATGDRVRVRSSRSEVVLEAVADVATPRGVVSIDFNLPGAAAAALVDAGAAVTEVRLESLQDPAPGEPAGEGQVP